MGRPRFAHPERKAEKFAPFLSLIADVEVDGPIQRQGRLLPPHLHTNDPALRNGAQSKGSPETTASMLGRNGCLGREAAKSAAASLLCDTFGACFGWLDGEPLDRGRERFGPVLFAIGQNLLRILLQTVVI